MAGKHNNGGKGPRITLDNSGDDLPDAVQATGRTVDVTDIGDVESDFDPLPSEITYRRKGIVPPQLHKAKQEISYLDELPRPVILMSPEAYRDTGHIIAASGSDEVGWLGTVSKLADDRYLIEKVFLIGQNVSGAHCEFEPKDFADFSNEMLAKGPEGKETLGKLLFWGHVHPGSMTSPSQQDEDQMANFDHNPYFIRGIFTREGPCVFTFFDYKKKYKVVDCEWRRQVEVDERAQQIAAEMKAKVRKAGFGRSVGYAPKQGGEYPWDLQEAPVPKFFGRRPGKK